MSRPRALRADDALWLIAADAPLARYGAERIESKLHDLEWVSACALAHEGVVEHVARAGTVVPMKLFTLFTSDERALGHIRRRRRSLERLLRRVAGRQEWGVRVGFDEARALSRHRDRRRPRGARLGPGAWFLARKREEHVAAGGLRSSARLEAERVFRALARKADAARRRAPLAVEGTPRVLLDAAFLVRSRRGPGFRAAVRAAARRLADQGCIVTLTGPWPPYNFVGSPR
jgi:hypothetical protein